jgi:outer membrane receptor protein involved in Fe transport
MTTTIKLARTRAAFGSFGVLATAVAAALAGPQLANAQQQQQTSATTEEIVVTGSRVSRSGFDTPQPVTAINADQIEDLGLVNVGDIARTMPQNTPFFAETNVGVGNFNVGAQLANLRGLNPFFGTRTLTLVDTKRVVPNSEGSAVDLTLIPSLLVERMEVVTGGASAAYGSDAIAGVVNVILNKNLEGFRAQVDMGQTTESDGDDMHASFAFGTAFGDGDRGHVLVGAEFQQQDPIGPCATNRDWCAESWAVHSNTGYSSGNGLPNFVVAPDSKLPTTETGLFTPFGGVQQQFTADGQDLMPYDPGQFAGFFTRLGGDGSLSSYSLSNIRPEIDRHTAMVRVSYDISDSLNYFAEVYSAASDSVGDPANGALGPFVGIIAPDNAFLSPALQAAAPAGGIFSRNYAPNLFSARNTTENDTLRFVTGLEGDFGEKWSWDAYYQYGKNENHQRLIHNMVGAFVPVPVPPTYNFLGWALDAVRSDPNDPNSSIVCRATIVGDPAYNPLAAGCVPLNLFGAVRPDQAAIDYVYRTLKEDTKYEQNVVGANFRSDLAEGWAGTIRGAFGVEFRQDEYMATHDLANQPWYNNYLLSWGLDRGGKIDVTEAYAEIDVPMAEKLQTNFAVRSTQTDATSATQAGVGASQSFESWKMAAIYDPIDWLRFRATRSQDIRSGNFRELFLPRNEVQAAPGGFPGPITNPWNGGAQEGYLSITGGNPGLKPETADTTTFGTVFSFENVRLSLDWFEIDMTDAITPGGAGGVSAQNLVDACFRGGTLACGFVEGWGTTDIISVEAGSINIGQFLTRGIDLEAVYDVPLDNGDNLNLRVIGSYLYDMIVDTGLGDPPFNYEGQSGPVGSFGGFNTSPNWQATAWLTYGHDRFRSTIEAKYIGSGSLNATRFASPPGAASNTQINSMTTNRVDDRYYFAWSGSYDFPLANSNDMQVFWAVTNLFDEDPPVAPGGNVYPTNPVFFDTIGRRYRLGVRFSF